MRITIIITILFLFATFTACTQSEEKKVESIAAPSPAASDQKTITVSAAPSEESLTVSDADGDSIIINSDKQNLYECESSAVMVNSSGGKLRLTGPCSKIVVNGSDNIVDADASISIYFNGSNNTVYYRKLANGKKPEVFYAGSDNKAIHRPGGSDTGSDQDTTVAEAEPGSAEIKTKTTDGRDVIIRADPDGKGTVTTTTTDGRAIDIRSSPKDGRIETKTRDGRKVTMRRGSITTTSSDGKKVTMNKDGIKIQ